MVILNFPNQFLDVEKQDKRLLREEYWQLEGETEGILNWALEGLLRLLERGHFIEPDYSKITKEQHRLEENPEREFIQDNIEFTGKKYDQVSTLELYKRYEAHCSDYGLLKKTANAFGQEVRRAFPRVKKTNPRMLKTIGKKVRFLVGVRYKEQASCTEKSTSLSACATSSTGVNNGR